MPRLELDGEKLSFLSVNGLENFIRLASIELVVLLFFSFSFFISSKFETDFAKPGVGVFIFIFIFELEYVLLSSLGLKN